MSSANHILHELHEIGASVKAERGRLIIRAGDKPVPPQLFALVKQTRAELIACLSGTTPRIRATDNYECKNTGPYGKDCAYCHRSGTSEAIVLPYGHKIDKPIWIHAECWPAWIMSLKNRCA